jgi:Flp pilus assembly protein TadG
MGLVGAAVDYSRASADQTRMQIALDSSVLAGARDGSSNWTNVAAGVFTSNYRPVSGGAVPTPVFSASNGQYSASASSATGTRIATILGQRQIPIRAAATAVAVPGATDTSCILALGKGQATTANVMTFNGSPNVKLTGCTLRSNASMRCNGHNTGASASISVGTTTGCSNPQSDADPVEDIYGALRSQITTKCTTYPGATWTPGSPPSSSKMVTIYLADRTEYHVCGDLTLSGSGSLTGSSPSTDTVIVIENGSLILANNSSITALRTAFVLTGNNSVPSVVDFPTGNGKEATLTTSPPTTASNPWVGISIFQDPNLTNGVDANWGPGANLLANGVVYLPNADLTLRGNAGSHAAGCSKLIVNTITVNGSVDMNHTGSACSSLGVKAWSAAAGSRVIQ